MSPVPHSLTPAPRSAVPRAPSPTCMLVPLPPSGLKSTQFILLNAIYEQKEIAQWRLGQGRPYGLGDDTISRRLAVLRNAGLITFRIGQEHSGEKLYRLTERGVSQLISVLPAWQRAQARLQAVMEPNNGSNF